MQLARIQADAAKLSEAEAKIEDLQRKKKVQENTYNYFVDSQNESNIKESMGSGRSTNIRPIQSPTPPFKEFGKFYKNTFALMSGGLIVGLVWAFLIEFYFDRSVKRAVEIETKLRIPFFLSIPDLGQKNGGNRLTGSGRKQLALGGAEKANAGALTTAANLEMNSMTVNHALDSHYDALRDRLVLYFESINLTRKPKLVAVTSTDKGAGVSTIASGLASSLSETGDGRVLLVDMNQENGAAQQFFNGKPNCKLDDALIREKREDAMVQDRLYVVSEGSQGDKLSRVLPKRFATLVPQLKASDYDYIIFDMPPVTQTSVTTRLAGFMDTVMLVIESEKSDRESVQQAHALLAQSKANVTAVLNKTKQYIPARLQNDINHRV
jgi:Mrp family chromosome partitioning ATPase